MAAKTQRSVSKFNNELKLKGFNVWELNDDCNATRVYSRKDFYKICLSTGSSTIHYADKSFDANDTVLFLETHMFPIHGKHAHPPTLAMLAYFQKIS